MNERPASYMAKMKASRDAWKGNGVFLKGRVDHSFADPASSHSTYCQSLYSSGKNIPSLYTKPFVLMFLLI